MDLKGALYDESMLKVLEADDIDENNSGLTNKINNISISPSPTQKENLLVGDIQTTNTNESKHDSNSNSGSFEEKIKLHMRYAKPITKNKSTTSVGNLISNVNVDSSGNYHSTTSNKKSTSIEITEDLEQNEKKIVPLEYVTNPDNHQIYFKYNFYKEKLGKDKMDSYMKSIESNNGSTSMLGPSIASIFGGLDEKTVKQLTLFGKLIIKVCYVKK